MQQAREQPPPAPIDEEQKLAYAGMYLLKKMDLRPEDGGMVFMVVLPPELSPLDEVFQELAVQDLVRLDARRGRWELTKKGLSYLAALIDEAEALVEEFEDDEVGDVLAELRARNLDPFRARFLWGWFDGELDDLVEFQRRRGARPVEPQWALYLRSDDFFRELARELQG
jgi:hypothetical protein